MTTTPTAAASEGVVREAAKAIRELRLADRACGRGDARADQRWDRALAELLPFEKRLAATAPAVEGGVREAFNSALQALQEDSTPIIRRLARIQIKAALEKEASND